MLAKPITYLNYNGEEVTETFYFNLNQSEIMEMELTTGGGFANMIQRIVDAKDQGAIFRLFKDIILKAYGEKTPNGKYLYKKDKDGTPLSMAFEQTEAYNVLLMELSTDAEKAAAFVNSIVPKEMLNAAAAPAATDSKTIYVESAE